MSDGPHSLQVVFHPLLILKYVLYQQLKEMNSVVPVHNWAISAKVSVGAQSHPNIMWDCKDCMWVHSCYPNWTASCACTLMHSGGNICTSSRYFFTFADGHEWVTDSLLCCVLQEALCPFLNTLIYHLCYLLTLYGKIMIMHIGSRHGHVVNMCPRDAVVTDLVVTK